MKKFISRRKHDLIEKTAEIYQSIVRDFMDGFWMVDMKGQLLDVNDAYCRLIGYSRRELLKMNVADLMVKQQSKDVVKHLRKIKKARKDRFVTQQRKKNGTLLDVELSANYANHLDGLVFVFLRDITGIKETESNQYRNRAESRKRIEDQLTDSYKHLGMINRKISLLLELEDFPMSKKHTKDIIDHILTLAMSISNAPMGYLYGSKGRGKFNLLSYKGCNEEQKEKIKVITSRNVGLLRHLLQEKKLISGEIRRYEAELLAMDNKLEYFITLPLSKETALGGFIFLGFNKKHNMSTQDLEFLDVFSTHASRALIKAGVFE